MMIKCLVAILCKTLFHQEERESERESEREKEREIDGKLINYVCD